MIIFDIETDGLKIDSITTIHCICTYDTVSGETYSFYGDDENTTNMMHRSCTTIEDGVQYLNEQEICGHNILCYDIPVLQKFYGWFKPKKATDTLILARILEPDRKEGHSLEAYAPQFGRTKVQNEDWSVSSEKIIERCQSDVKINASLLSYFEGLMVSYQDLSLPIKIENGVARICREQELHGWLFNKPQAERYISDLTDMVKDIDAEAEPLITPKVVKLCTIEKPFKKNGDLTERVKKVFIDQKSIGGSFSVIKYVKPDLNSEKQMKGLLLSLGWQPTQWNYKKDPINKKQFLKTPEGWLVKTSPKLTEDSYDSLPEGVGKMLAKRLKCRHRLNLLKGLLDLVRPDGRIAAKAITCGTNTARMRPTGIVNIPKNEESVFFGKEMRSLFTVPNDRCLIGCDAKALEARCLAHYINDPLFTKDLLDNDIHTVMQKIAGFPDGKEWRSRAKTVTYAVMYGAGDTKLGKAVDGTDKAGRELRKALFNRCPSIEALIKGVQAKAKAQKFVRAIDGRPLFTRSTHSALNTLLQGCGAIVMKYAMILAYNAIKKRGLNASQIGNFHDEFCYESSFKDSKEVAEILKQSIIKSGIFFKLRCPLDADYKIGKDWSETH